MLNRPLQADDPELYDLVQKEKRRQFSGLELIASEVRLHCYLGLVASYLILSCEILTTCQKCAGKGGIQQDVLNQIYLCRR
jgi:hypothetical protein